MTHTPPIPAGNQSPYPLQEPPHTPVATPVVVPVVARHDTDGGDGTAPSRLADLPIVAIGAAVGIGATLIGGILMSLRGVSKSRGSKQRGKGHRS